MRKKVKDITIRFFLFVFLVFFFFCFSTEQEETIVWMQLLTESVKRTIQSLRWWWWILKDLHSWTLHLKNRFLFLPDLQVGSDDDFFFLRHTVQGKGPCGMYWCLQTLSSYGILFWSWSVCAQFISISDAVQQLQYSGLSHCFSAIHFICPSFWQEGREEYTDIFQSARQNFPVTNVPFQFVYFEP